MSLEEIRAKAKDDDKARGILQEEEEHFAHKKEYIGGIRQLALVDSQIHHMWLRKDEALSKMEDLHKEEAKPEMVRETPASEQPKKIIKSIHRMTMFPKRTVETEADIDAYVENIRRRMKTMLKDCDGIELD